MMNETASLNGSSSLAISDKRPRKAGGCVGIFFQLFDWNRRFAKKKLFSKRLLPPDRAKEASKKFGGDEKLPKLRLIADENSGGFPNINKNGGSTSGNSNSNSNVVKNGVQAPSLVARLMGLESMPSVHRKDFSGEFRGGRREKQLVGNGDDFEKETSKQDFRPQKLQKTGIVERRSSSVTRFGAEAMQLKNVLSRSRKHHNHNHNHHHHTKLASPIKNPNHHHTRRNSSRLIGAATRILEPQSRNRVKPAITYPHSARIPLTNEPIKSQNLDLLNGQTSCKNCGNLVEVSDSPNGNSRLIIINQEKEFSTNVDRGHHQPHPQNLGFPTYFKENSRRTVDDVSLNCLPSSSSSATDSVSDTKDFVALNRSLSGRTRSRTPIKVEDTKFDKRGKFENGQKRPITHIRKQSENCGLVSSSNNRPRIVSNSGSNGGGGGGGNKNCDGMAFRFNSSMNKNRCENSTKLERRRILNGSLSKTSSRKKSSLNQIDDEKICLNQKPFPLTGDSLGAILEEKLKELANQVEYGIESKKRSSSANIFQELICALKKERPMISEKNDSEFSSRKNHLSRHRYDQKNTSFGLQTKSEKTGGLIGYKSIDHLSPGSVLEASFSNDSCCSSSLEDSSVRTQHADSMSYSYDESQFLDSETDPFFYSGVKDNNHHYDIVADLLTYISEVLSNLLDAGIKGNKRAHITETVFNAELVLGTQISQKQNQTNSFLVSRLLLELETVTEVMWMKFGNFLGSENPKAGYQMKRVVFDCLIEYLESRYGKYSKCGFRGWMAVPPFMGPEILVHEVVEEVRRWMGFVGRRSDELVEGDMSHWLGKWTDFEIQGYEIGARIEGDVFEMLVDEIVVDFFCCFRV